jgi:arginyl-tRNA synthetase
MASGRTMNMENYKHTIAELIASQLDGMETADVKEMLEYPPNPQMGDLSMPCFKLSKTMRKSPIAIAEELQRNMPVHDAVERVEATAGYLNIFLKQTTFAKTVLAEVISANERYGSQDIGQGRKIVIDFSSPNIAKHFHIGHLRSTMIGNALYQIFSFLGYECVGVNHLGDWGTQFGKMMVAYQLWGDQASVEEGGVTELQRLYVKFHEEAEKKPELEDEARAWFVKLEQGDAEANRLWKWFVEISLQEFNRIYDLLGVRFDSFAGESFYNDKMAPVVQELKDKNLLELDEGAMLIRLDEYNMPPALMLKKDGSTLYHTRDVTAALYRKQEYDFEKAIYVVGSPQNLHFQQLFKIVDLMGYSWAEDLVHVGFGQVRRQARNP